MADILIIGAGGVGSVVAHKCAQLAKEGAFGKITLASRTLSRCDEIARSVKARLGVDIATAQVDADKLKYPLTVRRWQEGDWFIPYGMSGRKKVSDYLIDHKVPLPEKARQFVLLSGDEIVWLVGRRIDDRYRLTAETENVLRITKEII